MNISIYAGACGRVFERVTKHALLSTTSAMTASLMLGVTVPSAAHAQRAGDSATTVTDVVVTARRREERVQDVPLAVTALSGKSLEEQHITNVMQLNGSFVGLQVQANPNGGTPNLPFFSIRAQSQQEAIGLNDPSVSLYMDEVVVPRAYGANLGFFDLAGVEVARGPQGTLFGRNTTGGAILVRSNRPTDRFEAYFSQSVGNYDAYTSEGMVNVPLGGPLGASFRIAAQHIERDGFSTDVLRNQRVDTLDDNAVRAGLLINPDGDWTNFTSAGWAKARDGGAPGLLTMVLDQVRLGPSPTDPLGPTGPLARQQARDIFHVASGVQQFSNIDNWYVTNNTSYRINENYTIINILGYRDVKSHSMLDGDASDRRMFSVERINSQKQWTEELQLQGTFDRFDFVAGAFYFKEKVSDQALSAGSLTAGAAFYGPDTLIEPNSVLAYAPNYSNTWVEPENSSYAIYLQGNYKITDRWAVTVGLRQNWDTRHTTVFNRAFQPAVSTAGLTCRFTLDEDHNPATPETRPTIQNCIFRDSKTFSEVTYNLSLQYKPTDDMLLYAAHRHGYRSGGFGARSATEVSLKIPFEPETVDDIELGVKADWRPGNMFLRTNLAVYYAKYKNVQRFLQISQAPPVTAAANAQEAHIKGFELEVLFRPNSLFEFSGTWAHVDPKFTDFVTPLGVDLSPQIYPHTPRDVYTLAAKFNVPTPERIGDMSLSLRYAHQSGEDTNDSYSSPILTDAGLPQTPAGAALANATNLGQWLKGRGIWDVDFTWNRVFGSKVDLTAFIENATNEKYLSPYQDINNEFSSRVAGAPRTYGVKLRYTFQ